MGELQDEALVGRPRLRTGCPHRNRRSAARSARQPDLSLILADLRKGKRMLFSRKSESGPAPIPAMPATIDAQERMQERVQPVRLPVDGHIVGGANSPHTQSFIDASLTIVGDLHSAGDVRIDGRICGNVRCAQLILGRDAAITGSVIADQAIVRGRLIGTIRAAVVVIQDSAHVESEITYGSLSVDDGAFFEGAVRRRDNPLEAPVDTQLLEVQQAAEATQAEPGPYATKGTETASSAPPAASEPPPPGGTVPMPNRHVPPSNGHSPAG
jgi:cytoskeletal protein CcmA (bactofilin family)